MSSEEDIELRDLVAETLENNGCLPKLRAELRASIFLALDENVELQKAQPRLNKKLRAHLETQEGQNMFCLVREFLEYFGLDFTISVYEPESYLGSEYHYGGREKVMEDLKIPELKDNSVPLLLQIIHIAQLKVKHQTNSLDINSGDMDQKNEIYLELCNKSELKQSTHSDTSLSEDLEQDEWKVSHNNFLNGNVDYIQDHFRNSTTNILNTTFNINTPIHNNVDNSKSLNDAGVSLCSIDTSKAEDTFDRTSLLSEDKSQSISSESEFSPPILKDKSHSKLDITYDKLKLSPQKTDKLKTKTSLSSLADLPPLQLNKSRTDTVLLPSLYSKDFKEKTVHQNMKEIDKLFDIETADNYEEDFLSDSEINNKGLTSLKNCFGELQILSISDSNKNSSSNIKSTELFKDHNQNPNFLKNKTEATVGKKNVYDNIDSKNNSESSSVSSNDLNRNVNDILNSATSN